MDLDPEFPFYQLCYAEHLVKGGRPEDYAPAGDILGRLAENSMFL